MIDKSSGEKRIIINAGETVLESAVPLGMAEGEQSFRLPPETRASALAE